MAAQRRSVGSSAAAALTSAAAAGLTSAAAALTSICPSAGAGLRRAPAGLRLAGLAPHHRGGHVRRQAHLPPPLAEHRDSAHQALHLARPQAGLTAIHLAGMTDDDGPGGHCHRLSGGIARQSRVR